MCGLKTVVPVSSIFLIALSMWFESNSKNTSRKRWMVLTTILWKWKFAAALFVLVCCCSEHLLSFSTWCCHGASIASNQSAMHRNETNLEASHSPGLSFKHVKTVAIQQAELTDICPKWADLSYLPLTSKWLMPSSESWLSFRYIHRVCNLEGSMYGKTRLVFLFKE